MVESISYWSDKEVLDKLYKDSNFYKLTIGRDISLAEIGGSFGHQLVYKKIVASGEPWAIIFEDDAYLMQKDLPVETFLSITKPTHINLAEHRRTIYSLRKKSNQLSRLIMPSTWAHAYMINLEAARRYAKNFEIYGITSYPDWPYPQPKGIKYFITNVEYFGQINPGNKPTMTDERLKIPMSSNSYSLVMPLSFIQLCKRIYHLVNLDFSLQDTFHHEVIIRCKVRGSSVIRKVGKVFQKFKSFD
jgi:hypothetical protein